MQREFFNLLLAITAGTMLLFGATICFRRIDESLRVDAHQEATRLDRHLPLRGKWLGYLLSAILLPIGFLAVFLGGIMFLGALVGLIGLLFGSK